MHPGGSDPATLEKRTVALREALDEVARDLAPGRACAGEELEDKDAKRPNVRLEIITLLCNDFRGQILGGPDDK